MRVRGKRRCLLALTFISLFLLIVSYWKDIKEIINDVDPGCGYFVLGNGTSDALGNLMFMYASFYGMVKRGVGNKTTFVRVTDYPSPWGHLPLRDFFGNLSIPEKVAPDSWFRSKKFTYQNEFTCSTYDGTGLQRLQCDGKNLMVLGCRQSIRYFDNVLEEVKKEFTFKKSIQEKCVNFFDDILAKKRLNRVACVTVAVHLRRGDFASDYRFRTGLRAASADYLQKAIRYHENAHYESKTKIVECLVFLIFGNDHEWNLNATGRVELMRPEKTHLILIDLKTSNPGIDMCVMQLCDHMIMSVGTFGWWVAVYIRGIVTYQKEYAQPNSVAYQAYDPKNYFFPHWIPL